MSTVRTIAKNTIVLSLGQGITSITGFIMITFIARFIGDIGLGKLSFAQSSTALLVVFADVGLSTLTMRELARRKDLTSKYLNNIILIKSFYSLVSIALIVLIINLMNYPADTTMIVYLIGISQIFGSFSTFLRSIFRAFEKMEFEVYLNIGRSVIIAGAGLTVLLLGYGLTAVALVYIVGAFIDLVATLLVTTRKFARLKPGVDFGFWKQVIPPALPFSVTAFVGLIYFQIDIVMLSVIQGDAPVGWYRVAYTIIYTLAVIPSLFSDSVSPVMSRLYSSSKDKLKVTMEKSAKFMFIIGLPIAVGSILLANRIIPLVFGEGYESSIIALQILSLYLPLRCINNATGFILSSIDKEPLHALSIAIAAATNIVLNFILIPRYSYAGAAAATAVTEIFLFAFYYYFVARHFHRLKLSPVLIRPCLACLVMGVFVYFLRNINLAALVFSGAAIYFIVLYLIGGFNREDKAMFGNLMKGIVTGVPLINKLPGYFTKQ
ncbi:flippase [Chloroflexota bacterium]